MQSFSELQLSDPLRRSLAELGFEKPSPIQAETLPVLLGEPTDFIGLAATGTGKTAAFAIPLLEKLNTQSGRVEALILCPTRELALQVSGQLDLLGKHLGVRSVAIYGGAGYGEQLRGLRQGASVVVGTPGRVIDHINKGSLNLASVRTLVLDEADEMVSMGFQDELEQILAALPSESARTWLFSATMSPAVREVAGRYLRQPKQVQVNRTETVPALVEQIYYTTSEGNKPEVLCKLIDAAPDFYGIIFCQTKALVAELHQFLSRRGYLADPLHGDMDQNAREKVMIAFRERQSRILIATDVACRGLDVKNVSHVVNYSVPRELDSYVHRIGRTGRNGSAGAALSLVTPSQRGLIRRLERVTRTRIPEGRIPSRREIAIAKVARTRELFETLDACPRAAELLDERWLAALAPLGKEEVAARFLTLLQPGVFSLGDSRPENRQEPKSEVRLEVRPAPAAVVVPSEPGAAPVKLEFSREKPRVSAFPGSRPAKSGPKFGPRFGNQPGQKSGRQFDRRSEPKKLSTAFPGWKRKNDRADERLESRGPGRAAAKPPRKNGGQLSEFYKPRKKIRPELQ
jgi:ATP-dependent RNA helicase DeaD